GAAESLESDVSGVRAAMQSRVHTWAAEVLAGLPFDVPVSVEVRDGDAARVLSRAARNAESLVVGTNAGSDHSPVAECVVPTLCEVVIVDENGHTEYLRGPYLRDDQTGRQVV
ncbi:MAG: hypothetical protein ACRDQD_11175, partial [Nocardioidaceae bacterium]